MEKLVLTDNTELEIMDGASLDYIRIQTDNFAALDQIAGALKKEGNLAKVQFKTDDEVTGEYEDLYLERPIFQEADMTPDGNVVSVIAFREKTELEKRVDAIERGQEIQNGALEDLGQVVSEIAEGGEK